MADSKYPGYKDERKRNIKEEGRAYPGYEDYSPEGRAQIRAFNRAGGADHLFPHNGSKREYDAARAYADDARQRYGTKQESARGKATSDEKKRKLTAEALRK
jgi:hypothetical protein